MARAYASIWLVINTKTDEIVDRFTRPSYADAYLDRHQNEPLVSKTGRVTKEIFELINQTQAIY